MNTTSNLKKALSVILVLMMVVSTMVLVPMTASAASAASATINVANAGDLANLNSKVAAATEDVVKINITGNIDMNGKTYTPVSTDKVIIFDGKDNTISNLSIGAEGSTVANAALFSTVGAGSVFQNLTISNITVWGGTRAAAVLALAPYGDLVFRNINVASGTITSPDGYAAALVAQNNDTVKTSTVLWVFNYCVNSANITGLTTTGGLVAYAKGGGINLQFVYCGNNGAVTTTNSDGKYNDYAGGILGYRDHGSAQVLSDAYFAYCYNKGALKVSDAGPNYAGALGGIVADIRFSPYVPNPEFDANNLKDGSTTTDIYSNNKYLYNNTLRIDNCYDYSSRSWEETTKAPGNYGILGYSGNTEASYRRISNCIAMSAGGTAYTAINPTNSTYTLTSNTVATDASVVTTPIATIDAAIAAYDYTSVPAGSGAATDPYLIEDEVDLVWVTALPYTYYATLTANIDMTGVPYAPASTEMAVHLDGARHAIQNLTISNADGSAALYAKLGRNSTFENLKMKDVNITGKTAAALVDTVVYGNLTFKNVQVSGSINATNGAAGFFAGNQAYTNAKVVEKLNFELCKNDAAVTSSAQSAGGMVGHTSGQIECHFLNCGNTGAITTNTSTANLGVGGLVGHIAHGGANYTDVHATFTNCYSTGIINATSSAVTVQQGGISGNYRMYGKASVSGAGKINSATFTNCFVTSSIETEAARKNSSYNMSSIFGMIANNESTKYVNNSFGIKVTGKTEYLGYGGTITNDEYSMLATSASESITLADGTTSTINAEIAKIETAIQNAFTWKPEMTITKDSGNLSARIHLRDDFGFMVITEFLNTDGTKMALADVAEYYEEYGFMFLQSAEEVTATEIQADGTAVEGTAYKYMVDGEENEHATKFQAAYTEVFAAELDVDIYFVAYAIDADGVVTTSEVRSMNLYDTISDGADGTICGQPVTNPAEQALYAEIINYYTKYVAYLDSVATPAA